MPTPTARPQQTHRPAKAAGRLGAGRVGDLEAPLRRCAAREETAARRWSFLLAALGAVAAGLASITAAAEDVAPAAGPTAAPGSGGTPQVVAIAAPDAIPAQDRGDVESEIAAVMDMTPPDRRVSLGLPSGSRLNVRPSGFLVGAGGPDCRRIEYSYEGLGTAVFAVGERCRQPNGLWTAAFVDVLVPLPPAAAPSDWPPAGPSDGPIGGPPGWSPGDESGDAAPSARDMLAFTSRGRATAAGGDDAQRDSMVAALRGMPCQPVGGDAAVTLHTNRTTGVIVNTEGRRIQLTKNLLRKNLERAVDRTFGLGSRGSAGSIGLRLTAGEREALPSWQA